MSDALDYRESHLHKGADYDAGLAADGFDGYMAVLERKILPKLCAKWFPDGIPRYLDFACGTGRATQFFETLADEPYGVDVSESMVEEARQKCSKTTFILQDITQQPLDMPPFDVISAFRFFGNAQDELRDAVMKELVSYLKEGGYLVFNNHRNTSTVHGLISRCTGEEGPGQFSHARVKQLVRDHGLVIRKLYGIGFWLFRYKYYEPRFLNSTAAKLLEPISKLPLLGRYCPDYVVVAQKVTR